MSAQTSLDLGGIVLSSDGTRAIAGAQIAPLIRARGPRAYLEGSASAARFENGSWTADADGLLVWRPEQTVVPGAEFVAGLGGARASSDKVTGHLWGRVRVHRPMLGMDVWLGGGGGRVDALLGGRNLAVAEAGALWADTRWSASVLATPTWVEEGIGYGDFVGTIRMEGALRLTGIIGFRQAWAPKVVDRGWIAWSAERPLSPTTTLVLSAGSFPDDPAQGFQDGRYLTLSVRIGRAERVPFGPPRSARAATTAPRWPNAALRLRPLGEDRYQLIVTLPGASVVEIAGDFSEWRPIALSQAGQRWTAELTLAPGVHRLNLRTDGGEWRAPPSLPATTDEFGGEVGMLVVP